MEQFLQFVGAAMFIYVAWAVVVSIIALVAFIMLIRNINKKI